MQKEVDEIENKTMEGDTMSLDYFIQTRMVFHKYHEMCTRPILNWHQAERRKHIKNRNLKGATAQDLEARKFANDVVEALNANIYLHLKISQLVFDRTSLKYNK